jgi:hypothetical protein
LQRDDSVLNDNCSVDCTAEQNWEQQSRWREGTVLSRKGRGEVSICSTSEIEGLAIGTSIEELIQGSLRGIDRVAEPFLGAVDASRLASESDICVGGTEEREGVDVPRGRECLRKHLDAVKQFVSAPTLSSAGESMPLSAEEIRELLKRRREVGE